MKKFGLLGTSALFGLRWLLPAPAFAQDTDRRRSVHARTGAGRHLQLVRRQRRRPPAARASPSPARASAVRTSNRPFRSPRSAASSSSSRATPTSATTLNELPQLRSTFAQQNPGLGIGIAGLNLLDLRGLGTQRTLVLVNGRRHVAADILNNAVSPDVNTIPNDLIERVDIVTGGNSAIYGSDAIAGVVNFILRRDFDGLQVRGQAGIAEEGFGGNQYVSAMYGMNFADGRGNITLHGEYARQERIFASDIPWFRHATTASSSSTSIRPACPTAATASRTASSSATSAARPSTSTAWSRSPSATSGTPARSAAPAPPPTMAARTRAARPTTAPSLHARRPARPADRHALRRRHHRRHRRRQRPDRPRGQTRLGPAVPGALQLQPARPLRSSATRSRSSSKPSANRVDALGNNAGPSFIQGTGGTVRLPRARPARQPVPQPGGPGDARRDPDPRAATPACRACDLHGRPAPAGRQPARAARHRARSPPAPSASSSRATCSTSAFATRTSSATPSASSAAFAARSTTTGATKSRPITASSRKTSTTDGFIDRQRFVLAMDAGRNPVTGQIQCRSQFDPAAAVPLPALRRDAARSPRERRRASRPTSPPACPTIRSAQPDNSASIDYFARTFTAHAELEQLVFSGFVSGDTSQLLRAAGRPDPLRDRRRISARRTPSTSRIRSSPTASPTASPSRPSSPITFEVKEAFAEIQIPILRDMPFFHELTVSGAARVANYQRRHGHRLGLQCRRRLGADPRHPLPRQLQPRGPCAERVGNRLPAGPELRAGLRRSLRPDRDRLGHRQPRGQLPGRSRRRSCRILTDVTYSLPIVSGSNPNLTEETSDSWTVGAVIQPRFIPGLSLSVDYYDITVDGVIVVARRADDRQQLLRLSRRLNNVFCAQFAR